MAILQSGKRTSRSPAKRDWALKSVRSLRGFIAANRSSQASGPLILQTTYPVTVRFAPFPRRDGVHIRPKSPSRRSRVVLNGVQTSSALCASDGRILGVGGGNRTRDRRRIGHRKLRPRSLRLDQLVEALRKHQALSLLEQLDDPVCKVPVSGCDLVNQRPDCGALGIQILQHVDECLIRVFLLPHVGLDCAPQHVLVAAGLGVADVAC